MPWATQSMADVAHALMHPPAQGRQNKNRETEDIFGASKNDAEAEGHRAGLRESLSRQLASELCVHVKEPALGKEEAAFQAKRTAHTKVLG